MKKVSAFSVFKGKKDKGDTSSMLDRDSSKRASLKKASSEPTINGDEDSRSRKLLRAIKGGSFRNTVRGNKHRPSHLADGMGNSPFVAGDGAEVKLTSVKGKVKTVESVNTSFSGTPSISKKARKSITPKSVESVKVSKQKKNLPPLPISNFSETPRSSTHLTKDETVSAGRNKGKRELDDATPSSSVTKKKRMESPRQALVQPVNPQRKDKLNKKKLMPNAVLETVYDSTEEARKLFECMIHPVQTDKFFKELWQKKPLLVRRHISNYNDGWFSTDELDRILEKDHIEFGVNLDVTSYRDGKRETHNPPGRAYRAVVWDYYQNGCSVRMLNPQTYSKNVWKMLSTLQEYFGCCVGANVYLTPPGTQGFAPHYDDIEAFILQLEGKKHWRLYNPRTEQETLPRESSGNFDQSDIGSPILDVTLEAGDLLYFPRGTIHQGYALEDTHSLHITFSCYQKNTWGDLFQKLMPRALEIAIEEDVEFREGLPVDYLHYTGVVNSDTESSQRDAFTQKISNLLTKMIQNYCPIDAACDQLGKQFIRDSLPPVFSEMEKSCSVHGHGEKWDPASQTVKGNTEVEPDTMIKLVRKGCLRLVTEDDTVRVYHNIENGRIYHAREPQFIEISADLAPAVEFLIHSYPEYSSVDSLPVPSVEEKVEISSILYDKGLLITGNRSTVSTDSEEDSSDIDVETLDEGEEYSTMSDSDTATLRSGVEKKKTSVSDKENRSSTVNNGMCLQEGNIEACKPQDGESNDYCGTEHSRSMPASPVPVELLSKEQKDRVAPVQNQNMLLANEIEDCIQEAHTNSTAADEKIQDINSTKKNNDRIPTDQIQNMESAIDLSLGSLESTVYNTHVVKVEESREMVEQNKQKSQVKQIQGITPIEKSELFLPAEPNKGTLQKKHNKNIVQKPIRGTGRDKRKVRDFEDDISPETDSNLSSLDDSSPYTGVSTCPVPLELFSTEQIRGMAQVQIRNMLQTSQCTDKVPEMQNYSMASEERIQHKIPAKKKNDRMPAGETETLNLIRHDNIIVKSEESLETVEQPQQKVQVKQIQGITPVENNDVFLPVEQNKDTLQIEQNRDSEEDSNPLSTNYGGNLYTCKLCFFTTKYADSLTRHMNNKHDKQNMPHLKCDFCKYKTTFKSCMKRHSMMHPESAGESVKTPKCNMCGASVDTEDELVKHKKDAHNYTVIEYKCEDCSFVTQRHDCLTKHYRIIHGNLEFVCCWKCSKSFYRKSDYDEHKCSAEELSVKCQFCSKLYSSPKCLQAHVKLHTGQFKHRCSVCDETFMKRFQLVRHVNIKHDHNTVRFQCGECPLSFLYKTSLTRHVKQVHPLSPSADSKTVTSSQSPQQTSTRDASTDEPEAQTSNYECPNCTCSYKVEASLIRHMLKKHVKAQVDSDDEQSSQ